MAEDGAEFESGGPQQAIPMEISGFRLSRLVNDEGELTLEHLPHPNNLVMNEGEELEATQQPLHDGLITFTQRNPVSLPAFMEGALATYYIFKEQSEKSGKPLPKVTQEIWDAYYDDMKEVVGSDLMEVTKSSPPVEERHKLIESGLEQFSEEHMARIATRESESRFVDALDLIAQGNFFETKTSFNLGAISVYETMQRSASSKQ